MIFSPGGHYLTLSTLAIFSIIEKPVYRDRISGWSLWTGGLSFQVKYIHDFVVYFSSALVDGFPILY